MKKMKIAALVCCVCLTVLVLAGCGASKAPASSSASSSSAASSSAAATATPAPTEAPAEVTKTAFFDFQVDSAELVDEYDGKKPSEGGAYLKLKISVTNTMDQDITMFDTDFQLKWNEKNGTLPLEASNDEMAPTQYTLKKGESASYVYVYEVPTGVEDFSVIFIEEFDNNKTGETYSIPVKLS